MRIPIYPITDDIEICSRVGLKVNIHHEFKVFVPVIGLGANCIHLLGCVDQVWVVRLPGSATILCLDHSAE